MNYKKNCITYWLPKLLKVKTLVPDTLVIDMNKVDKNFVPAIRKIFWMGESNKKDRIALTKFRQVLETMGKKIGYPFFLRTGQTSYKHEWFLTCFVQKQAILMKHAQNIAEYSIMADFKKGLPINVWVARKIIETNPAFEAFNGQMPITKEMRYFFKNHKIVCSHPYWPEHALEGQVHKDKNWKLKLEAMNKLSKEDKKTLKNLTEKIALEFEGYWSIDWLKGKNGRWYAIDMAVGEDSYHWKNCPNA